MRTLLILVAVVAVLLFSERTRRRWGEYRRLAAYHAERERLHLEGVAFFMQQSEKFWMMSRADPDWTQQIAIEAKTVESYREKVAYHARLKQEFLSRWW